VQAQMKHSRESRDSMSDVSGKMLHELKEIKRTVKENGGRM
jgi:hypothetical protein